MDQIRKMMTFLGLDELPEYEEFKQIAVYRELKKHELFYSTEDTTRYMYFLVSGVLRGFVTDADGKDITDSILFRYGQPHIGFLDAGLKNSPTEFAEALVDSQVIAVEAQSLRRLVKKSLPLCDRYSDLLLECYAEHWNHKNVLHSAAAMDRYHWFLETYPGIIDLVPHKHIASFLDMTPVTLSRLRRVEKEQLRIELIARSLEQEREKTEMP